VPGVKGTYLFKPVLFGRLLEGQKKVTKRLLETLNRKPKAAASPVDTARVKSPVS
jgi:hypothetical protein